MIPNVVVLRTTLVDSTGSMPWCQSPPVPTVNWGMP